MDSEELYDSLEEEFSSASSTSIVLLEPNSSLEATRLESKSVENTSSTYKLQIIAEPRPCLHQNDVSNFEEQFNSKCNIETNVGYTEDCNISLIVPLYGGDKSKTEVGEFQNRSSNSFGKYEHESNLAKNGCRRRRSIFTPHKNSKSSSNLEALVKNKIAKSYVDMFNNLIGYPSVFKEKEIEDSVRSLFGDSVRSLISEPSTEQDVFKDAEDNDSDTTSFYMKQIDTDCKHEGLKQTPESSIEGAVPVAKLSSNSELNVTSHSEKAARKPKLKRKKAVVEPMPVLGGLGPDLAAVQDKLERRQRQLNYGRKASNRNRIKMMEIKVLKNLKEEIENSNSN